jgi:hypothetical protein
MSNNQQEPYHHVQLRLVRPMIAVFQGACQQPASVLTRRTARCDVLRGGLHLPLGPVPGTRGLFV